MFHPTFHTPEEVASILRVQKSTVIRWLRTKAMTGQKVGRQWRIPTSAISEFVVVKQSAEDIV